MGGGILVQALIRRTDDPETLDSAGGASDGMVMASRWRSRRIAPSVTAAAPAPRRTSARSWALAGGYVALYVALDRVSYVFPIEPFAITPWNPPAGLSLAFLLLAGLRVAPALAVAALVADVLVRGGGVHLGLSILSSLVIAGFYTAVAALLIHVARIDTALRRLRDVAWLAGTAVPASLVVATAYVGLHAMAGLIPPQDVGTSVLRFWIGDMIGIVVTTPVLLAFARRPLQYLPSASRRGVETVAQVAATAAALGVVLWLGAPEAPRFFYLLFLPIIWIALRRGLHGTIIATLAVQVALIALLQLGQFREEHVLEFQFLMLSVALVGLFLGITVTERSRAQHALARSEAELRTTFDTAPDGLVTLDAAGRVTSANPAACAILRVSAAELVGRTFTSVVPEFESLPAEFTGAELSALRPDGTPVALEVSAAPARASGLHIVTLRDVSRRHAAEEKLRAKQEELTVVLRFAAAGQVASALAHELNQPLYALSTYVQSCQLLASSPDGDRAVLAELMGQAVREVTRAGEVVKRLREFFQSGATRLERVPVRRLLDGAAEASRRRAERHRIALSVECPDDLGEATCDALQIEIVLHNLVGNAIDALRTGASPRREIRLSARARDGQAEIRVEDSGPGIAEDVAARLFEPFTTTKQDGMGLGLSIARSIVETHGGRLWAERLPAGCAFCLSLPLERPEKNDA
jgi:PAS domain S-box-containing protein